MDPQQSPEIVYEYPLNQKIRGYLRIEQYRQMITSLLARNTDINITQSILAFIVELAEYVYRSDFKGDTLRELDKNLHFLKDIANSPEIDEGKLTNTINQFTNCYRNLSAIDHRIGHAVIQDPFIHLLRQRLQGGICTITDLPSLNYWLHQESELKKQGINNWLSEFHSLFASLDLIMTVKRDTSFFKPVAFKNGFLQLETHHASLCRLRLPNELRKLPEISVGGHRLSIHLKDAQPTAQSALNKADTSMYNSIQVALCP